MSLVSFIWQVAQTTWNGVMASRDVTWAGDYSLGR